VRIRSKGRLAEIASRVAFGASVIDIGCDHGFLPIYLAENGISQNTFASDIRPSPLATARRNAEKRGLSDKIGFFLADGIPAEAAPLVDTVIISGMGGETISGILDRAPGTLRDGVFFILQPQTKLDALLSFLHSNGFHEITLSEVTEGRKYSIITAKKGG
jgi:tRNA (adenine22-N1)-methyltransferase